MKLITISLYIAKLAKYINVIPQFFYMLKYYKFRKRGIKKWNNFLKRFENIPKMPTIENRINRYCFNNIGVKWFKDNIYYHKTPLFNKSFFSLKITKPWLSFVVNHYTPADIIELHYNVLKKILSYKTISKDEKNGTIKFILKKYNVILEASELLKTQILILCIDRSHCKDKKGKALISNCYVFNQFTVTSYENLNNIPIGLFIQYSILQDLWSFSIEDYKICEQ